MPEDVDLSVPSPDVTAVEPPATLTEPEPEPRGIKRAHSPDAYEDLSMASHDDHPKEDLRPPNRQRDAGYEAPKGEGLFGLLKIPWRAFVDGWNLRKNEAASSSTSN